MTQVNEPLCVLVEGRGPDSLYTLLRALHMSKESKPDALTSSPGRSPRRGEESRGDETGENSSGQFTVVLPLSEGRR